MHQEQQPREGIFIVCSVIGWSIFVFYFFGVVVGMKLSIRLERWRRPEIGHAHPSSGSYLWGNRSEGERARGFDNGGWCARRRSLVTRERREDVGEQTGWQ